MFLIYYTIITLVRGETTRVIISILHRIYKVTCNWSLDICHKTACIQSLEVCHKTTCIQSLGVCRKAAGILLLGVWSKHIRCNIPIITLEIRVKRKKNNLRDVDFVIINKFVMTIVKFISDDFHRRATQSTYDLKSDLSVSRVCVAHLFSFLCYVMFLALFIFAMCLVPNVACFSELSILAFIHSITHIVILIFQPFIVVMW
jgi:hypothetical protein